MMKSIRQSRIQIFSKRNRDLKPFHFDIKIRRRRRLFEVQIFVASSKLNCSNFISTYRKNPSLLGNTWVSWRQKDRQ